MHSDAMLHLIETVYIFWELKCVISALLVMWVDFNFRDIYGWTFSLEEVLLWIMNSYFCQKQQFKVKMS